MYDDQEKQFDYFDYVKSLQDEIKALKKRAAKFEAFDILRLRLALDKIDMASTMAKMASGVMIDIKNLDGQSITGEFGISDGLSDATLAAIKADIEKTFMARIDMNTPKSLRANTELMFRKDK